MLFFPSRLGHDDLDLNSFRSILDQRPQTQSLWPRWAAFAGFPTLGHAGYSFPTFGTTDQPAQIWELALLLWGGEPASLYNLGKYEAVIAWKTSRETHD